MSLSAHERRILARIPVASRNDPYNPAFPVNNPAFPATNTHELEGFDNVQIKNEASNPTGTHNDRLAWELIVTYRQILLAKKDGRIEGPLPQVSIVTAGSSALAIQRLLNTYGLPPLKCLVDLNLNQDVIEELEGIGCELYYIDLSRRRLSPEEILELTNNPTGIEATYANGLGATTRFYDWMSYEIMNNNPDYVFVPYGTGHLYENIMNISCQEVSRVDHDPRLQADVKRIRNCQFYGATTNNPESQASKLYAMHGMRTINEQRLRCYQLRGLCGPSAVREIDEAYLNEAISIAEERDIIAEPSALAGLALYLEMRDEIPKDKQVLIVCTGRADYNNDS